MERRTSRGAARLILFALLFRFLLFESQTLPADTEIRVLIYKSEGAAKTGDIESSLEQCNELNLVPGYTFRVTRRNFDSESRLDAGVLKFVDVLIIPGGYMYKFPRYWNREDIRLWVEGGGGYVGICGGEVLAIEGEVDDDFFGSFRGLEIAPHIQRTNPKWVGERNILMTELGTRTLGLAGDQRVLHWNGSILSYRSAPWQGEKVFAVFESNGEDVEEKEQGKDIWRSEWEGKAAILGDFYGRGRVVLSGPHPEFPSGDGKFKKPRMIGGMVKWAYQDDSPLPSVIGREDRLPELMPVSRLSAMSARLAADTEVSSMGLLLEGGSGRGVLGIYTDGRDGAPRLLLTQTDPFLVEQGLRWYRPSLRKPVRIPGDSTVWLAWVFENEAVLRADRPTNPGDIGKTRIRESGFSWTSLSGLSNPSNGDLPRYFPVTARISSQILSLYALGEEPGSGIR